MRQLVTALICVCLVGCKSDEVHLKPLPQAEIDRFLTVIEKLSPKDAPATLMGSQLILQQISDEGPSSPNRIRLDNALAKIAASAAKSKARSALAQTP